MTPVVPSSMTNVSLIPGVAFTVSRCNNCSTRQSIYRVRAKQRCSLPRPASRRLFPHNRIGLAIHYKPRSDHIVLATGTDVAVEEQDTPVAGEDSGESAEAPTEQEAGPAPAETKRSRGPRKSELPPVKNEELVPGATFTGKVRSIQPFGAFVDFGAFTDGLVHVSQLSNSFVKDVGSFVSVGQEVKVRLLEANTETGRISLTMREGDDSGSKTQQQVGSTSNGDSRPRTPRKNTGATGQKRAEARKASKFVKGQELTGMVKNLTRSGAFVSLPEGEEGFLPTSEEADGGFGSMMGSTSLEIGQEVNVRVLRIARGQVTLTMKTEGDVGKLDAELTQGVVHTAVNPFVLAFQKNKEIAVFLNEREKLEKSDKAAAEDEGIPESVEATMSETSVQTEVKEQESSENLSPEDNEPAASLITEEVPAADELKTDESGQNNPTPEVSEPAASLVSEDAIAKAEAQVEEIVSEVTQEVAVEEKSKSEDAVVKDEVPVEETVAEVAKDVPVEDKSESEDAVVKDEGQVEETVAEVTEEVAVEDKSEAEDAVVKDEGQVEETVAEVTEEVVVEEKSEAEDAVVKDEGQVEETVAEVTQEVAVEEENESEDAVVKDEGQVEETVAEVTQEVAVEEKNESEDAVVKDEGQVEETVASELAVEEKNESEDAVVKDEGQVEETVAEVTEEVEVEEKSEAEDAVVKDEVPVEETVAEVTEEVEVEEKSEAEDAVVKDEVPVEETVAEVTEEVEVEEKSEAEDAVVKDEVPVEETVAEVTQEVAVEEKNESEDAVVKDEGQVEETVASELAVEDMVESSTYENGTVSSSDVQTDVSSSEITESKVTEEPQESRVEEPVTAAATESSPDATPEDENDVPAPDGNGSIAGSNGQGSTDLPKESGVQASISPALVKQLREETGAGMMDCKKALAETGGDLVKAQEFLRKKGLASAEKKAARATAEGRIGSYIHDSRIGVLVEVNCETDFVSRGEIFKELVEDLAMQVAACPQVRYLVTDEVPADIVSKEKEIEMQKEDLMSKPENIRERIVEGRIRKRLEELALLEQPYIKNDKVVVKDWVKQTIATVGENIKVKRFVRFNLGEGLEKKSQDFAAEVAAQTAAKTQPKPSPAAEEQKPAAPEAETTASKAPTVAVSAALVKQLREETGAGMMDCKKALAETGGDLEKAQEYLRKKGLSTADKKSSRLAAEGRIGSYIHDSRIGVLIEVNCETDFVGRSEKFKELVDDLAMQVVACPQVQFVSVDDIPEDIVKKEKELEMHREDLQSKPENIRERIVEGRVSKRLGELALLEQAFIKDDSILVKDLVKRTVAALGENIKVRRFMRFTLGESTEGDAEAKEE
ncbi:hypothetical protein CRG98_011317 [Punica granatum]|uniref:Elongation factor Ts, mitochondrial n=1 Tax=Punica granatum TaxID=22663 RepID=A0A2I0KIE6_PUNGR|nr:hypothetical protein CRG98_011317 [Punica granatum]